MKVPVPDGAAAGRPSSAGSTSSASAAPACPHRPDHAGPRHPGQRQRRQRLADPPGAARARRRVPPRPRRRRTSRDVDTVVVSTAVREDNPEVRRGPAPGPAGAARARPALAVGDGRPPGGRGRRHPRQDHHHLAADRRAAGGRRRPDVRHRRRPRRDRASTPTTARGDLFVAEADESDGAFLRLLAVRRDRHQRRGRPPRQLGHRGGLPRGLRRVRRHASTPTASWSACVDDPGAAALAATPRDRGLRGRRVGESATPTCAPATCASRAPRRVHRRSTATPARRGRPADPGPPLRPRRAGRAGRRAAARLRLRRPAPPGSRRFTGTRRRMERKGEAGGVRVYDSYAHHPAEIAGDLAGRPRGRGGRPRWSSPSSRTWSRAPASSAPAMGEALGAADEVVVLDVYLAREDADPAVTGALVADAVPLPPERVAFVPDFDDVAAELVARARPGDLVLTLGAGTVTEVGPRVLELLAERAMRRPATARRPTRRSPAEPRPRALAARFARRQWARRWLAWQLVVAGVAAGRAGGRQRSGSSSSPPCSRSRASRSRAATTLSDAQVVRRGRRARRRAAGPRRPRPRSAPGARRSPPCRSADVTPAVARPGADRVVERAQPRRRRRRSAAGCAAWTPTAWSSATTPGPGRPAAGADLRATPAARRCARRAAVVAALPARPGRARSTTSRSQTVDEISLVLRDGRTVEWGSADESDAEGRGARRPARSRQAERYDVSVPGQPTRPADAGRTRPTPADPAESRDASRGRVCHGSAGRGCLLS